VQGDEHGCEPNRDQQTAEADPSASATARGYRQATEQRDQQTDLSDSPRGRVMEGQRKHRSRIFSLHDRQRKFDRGRQTEKASFLHRPKAAELSRSPVAETPAEADSSRPTELDPVRTHCADKAVGGGEMRRRPAIRSLITLLALAIALGMTGSASADLALWFSSPRAQARTITGRGLAIELPVRWSGVIYQRVGGLPILHAASLRLPPVDGDDGAQSVVPRMHKHDVLIVLLEVSRPAAASFPPLTSPLRIQRRDFGAPVEGFPLNRAFAHRHCRISGRGFDLWVEFGTGKASATSLRDANRVLATLPVRPR